jgi:integrase
VHGLSGDVVAAISQPTQATAPPPLLIGDTAKTITNNPLEDTPMSKPLSQAAINKLSCPPHRKSIQYPVDPQVPGLLIEVRHTGSKSYFLRYRDADNATRYRKISRSMDLSLSAVKKEALRLRSGIVLKQYPGADKVVKTQCMTFSEFFEQKYLPFAKPRKRSWRDDEKLFTTRIRDRFGHLPLNQISRHAIQQFHGELKESGLAPATCDHFLGLISRCFRLAVEWQLLPENPANGLKKFNAENGRDVYLSPDELKKVLEILDHDRAVVPSLAIKLLIFTGARVGEALHAKWSDIDVEAAVWTVQAENSKSKKRRKIPLNKEALRVLDQLTSLSNCEYVFTSSRRAGKRLTTIDRFWQRVRGEFDLSHVRIHDLRRTFSAALLDAGVPIFNLQSILGHAQVQTTLRYSNLSPSALLESANTVSQYLDKARDDNSVDAP